MGPLYLVLMIVSVTFVVVLAEDIKSLPTPNYEEMIKSSIKQSREVRQDMEDRLLDKKDRMIEQSSAYYDDELDIPINDVFIANEEAARRSPATSNHGSMEATLDHHGVPENLMREIHSMASSYIPRETIVKHVKSHFPGKSESDWNDIVVSAIGVGGRAMPKNQDFKKANAVRHKLKKEKFEKEKERLAAKKSKL